MTYTQPAPHDIARRRAELAPFDGWNERAFAAFVAWQGVPKTYLDLGSGTGAMVNFARKLGVDAWGVDVINGPEGHFIHHDLAQPLALNRRFAVISCIEVAEHLPEDGASVLCDTIARHLAPGGLLIFSAATPGQGGEHHVNCQPPVYWRARLHERGISYRSDYTKELALLWALTTGPAAGWLAANLQVFDCWDGEIKQEIG